MTKMMTTTLTDDDDNNNGSLICSARVEGISQR